ncbi:hypothetical protein HHK36_011432 [Tetracentron sinense]|uniref:Uncharacterized protein n=1 Tax=Tetracentron sinense TaxID=13715 RepID=A0A834ZCP5_TETSI|nr:hypothetical protein HHK36_011432 [Tetracentron sinense]
MESNRAYVFRHPSTERFLGVVHQPKADNIIGDSTVSGTGEELDEDEVFWTGDFSESNHRPKPPSITAIKNQHSMGFRPPENFGILAALPEEEKQRTLGDRSILYRKTSISSSPSSSSMMIPVIPKHPQSHHEREYSQSVPSGKYHQSAPVNVPALSKAVAADAKGRNHVIPEVDDEDGEDEMLPPHEIVARGSDRTPLTTFSVLEGVGRTLKGRDLRQAQILNTSPMSSLYEAFATVDGDECRRSLLPTTPSPELSPPVPDQMAFAAPSGSRSAGNCPYCQHCCKSGHVIDRCFDLHPELKQRYSRNQLQSKIAQLQSHLGLGPASSATISFASPTATLGYSPLLPHPAPILEPPPVSSPSLTSRSLPLVILLIPSFMFLAVHTLMFLAVHTLMFFRQTLLRTQVCAAAKIMRLWEEVELGCKGKCEVTGQHNGEMMVLM